MRAAVYHGRRDVRVEEVPDPTGAPAPGAVRLRVLRAALCGTDAGEYAHGPRMIPLTRRHPGSGHVGPTVMGHELVGEVEEVGAGVEGIAPGDRVVPGAGAWCGTCGWCAAGRTNLCERYWTVGLNADGGLTERLDVPAAMCRPVPPGCTDDAAAMAQPVAVALHAVDRARVAPDEPVVLLGVGGIGLFILAGLAARGARVAAVDVDPAKLAAARRAGAVAALDARSGDLAEEVATALGGPVGAVIEASGAASAPATGQALVARGGRLVLVGMQAAPRPLDLTDLVLREVDLLTSVAHVCDHDLPAALDLLAGSTLADDALDRVIPLGAVVEEGLEPLAAGGVEGKVVVDPRG